MNALRAHVAPLTPGSLDVDAGALLSARPKVSYVCTPNNPTGSVCSRAALDELLGGGGVVIVDEAYAEYQDAPEGLLAEAPRHENLLVVRTLSKAFGLAGLRVGYAVGNARLVAEVEKSRGPYKVSRLGELMGVEALTTDLPWVREKVAEVKENRAKLFEALTARGFRPLPSQANFLLVPVAKDAKALAAKMRESGVSVRPFPALPLGLGECLRVSVGPWSMMEAALAALSGGAAPPRRR
jgi:histidinol-phosphate/aromatic aminotransferase/cobyric acid decarboxylase-like protein